MRVPAQMRLFRIFDPTRYGATPASFRFNGPRGRFDHQRGSGPPSYAPTDDPERGVYYAASSLSSCLVEVFGDTGIIVFTELHVAKPKVIRDLDLLDLRAPGAMRVGSVAALAKTADRSLSQAWSRHFYEHPEVFGEVDGLLYFNAHNDEEAIVLFERAAGAIDCPDDQVLRLDDPDLRTIVEDIGRENNLVIL